MVTNELVQPLQKEISFVMLDTFKRYKQTDLFKKSYKKYKTIQETEKQPVQ